MFPLLKTSRKDRYPFRLGTTSFIYPADYITNVRLLGPYLDEIELLLLESHSPECFPSKGEIRQLAGASEGERLTYNVHLPTDIHPGDPDPGIRNHALEVLLDVFELTAPLAPVTHTLHLDYRPDVEGRGDRSEWQKRVEESLNRLIAEGISAESISIETLHYPIQWAMEVIEGQGLKVCIDTGHLVLQGLNPGKLLDEVFDETAIIHLHGIRDGRDHQSLACFGPDGRWIYEMLKSFGGSVSIEVFSFHQLESSLNYLDRLWNSNTNEKGSVR